MNIFDRFVIGDEEVMAVQILNQKEKEHD